MRPLLVVEASAGALESARRELERAGHAVVDGWAGGAEAVCCAPVRNHEEAAAALLAALEGRGLLVHALAERDVVDRLVEDLRRLGPVEHRTSEPAPRVPLTPDERGLLDLLAAGRTLGEAAAELHLSRRTADRRLASARLKLGAASTAAAVAAHAAQRAP